MRLGPLFAGFGGLVEKGAGEHDISSFAARPLEVVDALRSAGVLLFRGFDVDVDRFAALSGAVCRSFQTHGLSRHRNAVSPDRTIQTVLKGSDNVTLHVELGYLPFRPDVLWLYCKRPPAQGGGETLVCD